MDYLQEFGLHTAESFAWEAGAINSFSFLGGAGREQTKVNHLSRKQHLSAHHKCQKRALESIWCALAVCGPLVIDGAMRKRAGDDPTAGRGCASARARGH